jgi:lysophospholipase L1-like esterase
MNRAASGFLRLSWLPAAALGLTIASGCGTRENDPFAGSAGGSGGAGAAAGSGGGPGGPSGSAGAPAGMAGAGGATPAPGGGGGSGSAGSGGSPVTGAPDGGAPSSAGRPRPARLVVLGDSIAACSNVGNENGPDCSLKKLADHLRSKYAPALVYENEAVGAAVTSDVPTQMGRVMGGPGHVLVLVYVGGNDLAKYMFASDAAAEQGFMTDLPRVLASWSQVFAFFDDRTRFPDGYTLVMNTQYNPFDDCTAAPYFLSAKKIELLGVFNMELARVAREKSAILTDQYKPYLGHGHHYNVRTCPNFMQGATPFMADLIHPNPAGHENLFQQWKTVIDRLYQ